jgi:hypothetical protein
MKLLALKAVLPVLLLDGLVACGGDTSVCISFNTEKNLCQLPAPGQSMPKPGEYEGMARAGEVSPGAAAEAGEQGGDAGATNRGQ